MFNPHKALQLIEESSGKIFRVVFRRRTDKVLKGHVVARAGDLRTMICRIKVKSRVSGSGDPAARKARDLANETITVFEMAGEKSGYKTIPLDSIVELTLADKQEGE